MMQGRFWYCDQRKIARKKRVLFKDRFNEWRLHNNWKRLGSY